MQTHLLSLYESALLGFYQNLEEEFHKLDDKCPGSIDNSTIVSYSSGTFHVISNSGDILLNWKYPEVKTIDSEKVVLTKGEIWGIVNNN